MPRAVRFDRYGDEDVLHLVPVMVPEPVGQQVLVEVRSAGVCTYDARARSGLLPSRTPSRFPRGQGFALAGVVQAVGDGVLDLVVGDEVIGWSSACEAQADLVVLAETSTVRRPPGLNWDTAAAAVVPGATARAAVDAIAPFPGDTVVVAVGSGSTGVVAVQLALQHGTRVIATADEADHAFLRQLGAEPVPYGAGRDDQIRELSPHGIDAFADCHGEGDVELALSLGVKPNRINSSVDQQSADRSGVHAHGLEQVHDLVGVVQTVAERLARGAMVLPIKDRYPLEKVRDAYRRLAQPGIGSVVLQVSEDEEPPSPPGGWSA